jgi:hypothetical protein
MLLYGNRALVPLSGTARLLLRKRQNSPERVLLSNVEAWFEMYHQDRTIIYPHHGKT